MEHRVTRGRAVVVVLATLAVVIAQLIVPKLAPRAAAADPPPPGSITLQVKSARSLNPAAPSTAGFAPAGTPITTYKWLINLDDVGDPCLLYTSPSPRDGL